MFTNSKFSLYFRALLCATVLVVPLKPMTAAAKTKSQDERVTYIFKAGDTLIDLASKYMRKRSDYVFVQRLNHIKNPYKISVGKTITIPFRILKFRSSEANISAFRGNVSISLKGKAIKPAKGLSIKEGSQLATSGRSSVTLRLEDGSRISMPSNSKVKINRLRHLLITDSVDYEFSVDSGRMRSKVTPFNRKAGRYRVRTPVAVSAVRGTDYRTRVDEASGTAFSETVEGEILVASGSQLDSAEVLSIPAGSGAAANTSVGLVRAELLAAPKLQNPEKVQADNDLQFNIAPTDDAIGSRIVVSSDAGFVDLVAEQSVDGNTVTIPSIPNGRYFAKASAIARDGFEGMPATYTFKRQLSTLSGIAEQGDFGYRFKWDGEGKGQRIYRFQLMLGEKTGVPIVDEVALTSDLLTLSELPDGEYYWRVGVTQFSNDPSDTKPFHRWTEFEKLTVAG